MPKLSQKVALVTGGASGLGKAIAQRLAADGASVIITDVQRDLGNATSAENGLEFFEQDVCEEATWAQVIRKAEERFSRIDILVNNAGIIGPKDAFSPEDSRLSDWKRVFSINVEGVFLGCRAAISSMRKTGGGTIINISSVAGLLATPYATAYGASKAAVRQLTKSVAQYCAQERLNIRCNSVHPGNVRTPLWDKAALELAHVRGVSFEEIVAEGQSIAPMGEFMLPADIAAAVAFLASDDARYITGCKMIVDGGIINCDTYHMGSQRPRAIANP
jgi:3(or 17)beta-hydroxysteroid dehydrogenase